MRPLLVALLAWFLAACQVDIVVDVSMNEDGTGTVTVTAVADADVVAEAPDLATELELGDAEAAGWSIEGPEPTDDGGLAVRASHAFHDADEANALLSSLGRPLSAIELSRVVELDGDEASATNTLSGSAVLRNGFAGFADQALLDAAGGVPFANRIGDRTPEETMTVRLDAQLPGDVQQTTGDRRDDTVSWIVPLDGSAADIELVTTQTPGEAAGWAGPVATIALVALIVWIAVCLCFAALVVHRRRAANDLRSGQIR